MSFDVFFSYHWRDQATVEAIALTLTQHGVRVFLDRWYLTPGQPWLQALEQTLASCNAVAIFLGPNGLGRWQQRERDLALDRQGSEPGFPVIPVLLTRSDPALGFLKLNTWIDLSANPTDPETLDLFRAAIRRQPPQTALTQTAAVRAQICPYRGLHPFREEDAAFFCGREAFTAELIEAIDCSSLVAVTGASGSGKSSVVRAGLIPHLRRTKAGLIWEFATLVPTNRPLHSLAAALVPLLQPELTRVERLVEIKKLAGHFAEQSVSLRDVVAEVLRAQSGTDRLLLFVDQWEELYTSAEHAARRRFLNELIDASTNAAMTLIFTLRGDFFAHALSDRALADRLRDGQVNLGPMTEEELRRSIVQPAEMTGLTFEPGLVDRILEDVGQEPGNLPLLEFVLTALWEQRQGATLLHDAYESIGGVRGAIAARADAEFQKLDAAEKNAARHFLIQMVRPGEGTADTAQRARLPSQDDPALSVIRRLADARLLVTARDAATGEETVEVTHEALIRNWTLLRGWVDEDRELLRRKARIEAAASLWQSEGRDASRLLAPGRPLAEASELLASRRVDLRPDVVRFVDASSRAAARTLRRKRLLKTTAVSLAVLAVAAVTLFWDLRVRDYAEYYNSYARRWGALEGVGRVPADDAARRSRTFRFSRKGRLGPVVRVEAVDGTGACARMGLQDLSLGAADPFGNWDSPTRICSIAWERDSQDQLTKQTMRDAEGRIQLNLLYTGERTAEFRSEEGYAVPIGLATTIRYERINHGPNRGQDSLERYTDAFGQTKPGLGGWYAARVEYNAQGLVVRFVLLGEDNKPMANSAGFAETRMRYDDAGRPVEIAWFDERAQPIRLRNGTARQTMRYDARGNEVEEAYFDEEGKLTQRSEGYAQLRLTHDDRGKEIERTYLDEAGRLVRNNEGYARIVREFDSEGTPTGEGYFDENGNSTLSNNGYARVAKRRDKSRNAVEEEYFEERGKPIRSKKGYTKVRRRFNDGGGLTAEGYFDGAGQPTLSKDGCAVRTLSYDTHGNGPVSEACLDTLGKLTLSKDGYATVMKRYDTSGKEIERKYLDEAGKPALAKEGYAESVITYDDRGNKAKVAYFDTAGSPTLEKSRYASVVFAYDPRGNMVKRSYYDENGRPTRSKAKYAAVVRTYDARGDVIEEAFFDEEGKPCLNENGVAKAVLEYDKRHKAVRQAHFDETGKPVLSKERVAQMLSTYDARGNKVEEAYLDQAGKPVRSSHGYAKAITAFDSRGQFVEQVYLDEAGKPTAIDAGYASIKVIRDGRGNQIEESYFDAESRPARSTNGYSKQTRVFDDRDNVIEQAFFDEAGHLVRSAEGYARLSQAYDRRDNVIEQTFFDVVGRRTRSKYNYADVKATYDVHGNQVKAIFFDESGHPIANTDGVIAWEADYDGRGRVTKVRLLDGEGKPTRSKDGYAAMSKNYDSRGNRILDAYYDEKGKPIRTKDGYASISRQYDARDNVIREAYFDEKGKPTRSRDGYALVIKTYGSRDEVTKHAYFDENGRAVRGP